MKKTLTQIALSASLFGMMSSTALSAVSADSFKNESGITSSTQENTEKQRIEIPSFSSGRGDIKVELEIVDGEIRVYTNFNLNPSGYYATKLFTHEDGVEERSTTTPSDEQYFVLNGASLNVLKSQLSTNEYATMGVDVLTYDEQIPIGMVFVSDLINAYNDLKQNEADTPANDTQDLTVQPFKIGQDRTIKGTFNSKGTNDKDTLMLMVNHLGRRLVIFPKMAEDEQTGEQTFEISAVDFVNSLNKEVSIVHIKDGKVVSEVSVPLV